MTSHPQTPTSMARRAVILTGLATQPLTILAEIVAAFVVRAPYSFAHNTISDLGATTCTDIAYPYGPVPVCSPLHTLVNGSFILFGALLAIGAIAVFPLLPKGFGRVAGVALLVVAGLSSLASGLIPLDIDIVGHSLVSLPVFLAQPLALVVLGVVLRRSALTGARALSQAGIVAGAIGLIAGTVFLGWIDLPAHGGTLERLALWPGSLWFAALAAALTRKAGRRRATLTP